MNIKMLTAIAVVSLGLAAVPAKADVKIGTLACDVDPGIGYLIGSSKDAYCEFTALDGTVTEYEGHVGKLGVDIGYTQATRIIWAVVAPGSSSSHSLAGSYTGVNAEATIGVGVGANVLVGGVRKSINLQPISLQGQAGLNAALTVSSLTLKKAHK